MDNQWKYAGVAGASILLTLAAAAGYAQTAGAGMGRFGRDANGDGVVTRAEWVAAANAQFDRLDANHDGKLDATERPGHGHGRRHGPRPPFDGRAHSGYDDGTGAPPTLGNGTAPPR